ncbi:MAG: hypothetical protein AB1765_12225 [Candidatus Hydrogenedentota bacterium]
MKILLFCSAPFKIVLNYLQTRINNQCLYYVLIRDDFAQKIEKPDNVIFLTYSHSNNINLSIIKKYPIIKNIVFNRIVILVNLNFPKTELKFKDYYNLIIHNYNNVELVTALLKTDLIEYIDISMNSFTVKPHYLKYKLCIDYIDIKIFLPLLTYIISLINKILPHLVKIIRCKGVVILPNNVAFAPQLLTDELKARNINAEYLNIHRYNIITDSLINIEDYILYSNKLLVKYYHFVRLYLKYNVFHYHFTELLFTEFNELELLKKGNKKIVSHYQGCDIRIDKIIKSKYPINVCKECDRLCGGEVIQKNKINRFKMYADLHIVAIPDILEFCPEGKLLFDSINDKNIKLNKIKNPDEKINIIHAPTFRKLKGTEYIISATRRLKEEGYNIELKIIENTPHNLAEKIYDIADIAVDQLIQGWYGIFAMEMMARGVTVLSYIRDDIMKYVPGCPIINTNPYNIYENLKNIIDKKIYLDPELRNRNVKYVKKMHTTAIAVDKLLEYYHQAGILLT